MVMGPDNCRSVNVCEIIYPLVVDVMAWRVPNKHQMLPGSREFFQQSHPLDVPGIVGLFNRNTEYVGSKRDNRNRDSTSCKPMSKPPAPPMRLAQMPKRLYQQEKH